MTQNCYRVGVNERKIVARKPIAASHATKHNAESPLGVATNAASAKGRQSTNAMFALPPNLSRSNRGNDKGDPCEESSREGDDNPRPAGQCGLAHAEHALQSRRRDCVV
jgi:hypothetical protein